MSPDNIRADKIRLLFTQPAQKRRRKEKVLFTHSVHTESGFSPADKKTILFDALCELEYSNFLGRFYQF